MQGLRVAGSVFALRLNTVAFLGMGMSATLVDDASLLSASAEYAISTLTFAAEYTRSRSNQVSVLPGNTFDITSDGGYVMLTWLAARWLQPGAYYALFYPDISNRHGPSQRPHDATLTLRFDINSHWLVKLEGHYMEGTAGWSTVSASTPRP